MNDHQGRVLLVTAVPGSGKTTIMKKRPATQRPSDPTRVGVRQLA